MADSNSETLPLLLLNASEENEEDLDDSRETETTDVEYLEDLTVDEPIASISGVATGKFKAGASHFEQSGTSQHSNNSSESLSSSGTLSSQPVKGKEALSYFDGDALTSSSDSSKGNSLSGSTDVGYVVEYTTDKEGNPDYIDIDLSDDISEKHVTELMNKMRYTLYTAMSYGGDFTLSKCKRLFERDYVCKIVLNSGGSLSRHYPAWLIIPTAQASYIIQHKRFDAINFEQASYVSKVKRSVCSRLMTRFVVPVILFDKKFICRSGSLSVRKTAAFEMARQKEAPKDVEITATAIQQIARKLVDSLANFSNRTRRTASQLFFPNSMSELREIDAEILRDLNVKHICDLMVENRKMFKQTIRISSSEKINRNIFKDCEIEQMPYPGCSFFRQYHGAKHDAHGLVFDWERPDVNVEMKFSVEPNTIYPDINWSDYKKWDVVNLTKHYLKMLLAYLVKDSGGMLIHCVSGWDRTPLFISLLRVSLWADGLIHRSLDCRDMAYFTLAYDWYLFGHNFPYRLREGKEILHFCFNFLENIVSEEFSATRMFHELPVDEKRGRVFPDFEPTRRGTILKDLRTYVMDIYTKHTTHQPYFDLNRF